MNPLNPTPAMLAKLGSVIAHAEELVSDKGHHFDLEAFKRVLSDPDVQAWLEAMHDMALIPLARENKGKQSP